MTAVEQRLKMLEAMHAATLAHNKVGDVREWTRLQTKLDHYSRKGVNGVDMQVKPQDTGFIGIGDIMKQYPGPTVRVNGEIFGIQSTGTAPLCKG